MTEYNIFVIKEYDRPKLDLLTEAKLNIFCWFCNESNGYRRVQRLILFISNKYLTFALHTRALYDHSTHTTITIDHAPTGLLGGSDLCEKTLVLTEKITKKLDQTIKFLFLYLSSTELKTLASGMWFELYFVKVWLLVNKFCFVFIYFFTFYVCFCKHVQEKKSLTNNMLSIKETWSINLENTLWCKYWSRLFSIT